MKAENAIGRRQVFSVYCPHPNGLSLHGDDAQWALEKNCLDDDEICGGRVDDCTFGRPTRGEASRQTLFILDKAKAYSCLISVIL